MSNALLPGTVEGDPEERKPGLTHRRLIAAKRYEDYLEEIKAREPLFATQRARRKLGHLYAMRILESDQYEDYVLRRMQNGTLPPQIEALMFLLAFGDPRKSDADIAENDIIHHPGALDARAEDVETRELGAPEEVLARVAAHMESLRTARKSIREDGLKTLRDAYDRGDIAPIKGLAPAGKIEDVIRLPEAKRA